MRCVLKHGVNLSKGHSRRSGEGSCVSKAPERGWGGYPLEQQKWEGQVCRLACESIFSGRGEPDAPKACEQMSTMGNWPVDYLWTRVCPSHQLLRQRGLQAGVRGGYWLQGAIDQLTCALEPASSAKWSYPSHPILPPRAV